jgi:serine/threonine protein phosphatase PrpC
VNVPSDVEYRLYLKSPGETALKRAIPGECFEGTLVSLLPGIPPRFLFVADGSPCLSAGMPKPLLWVNGQPIQGAAIVEHGTLLQIGDKPYEAMIQRYERATDPTVPHRPAGLDAAVAAVRANVPFYGGCAADLYLGRRAVQEDFIGCGMLSGSDQLWIVADGVGGESQGDVASEFATRWTLWRYFQLAEAALANNQSPPPAAWRLQTAITEANQQLIAFSTYLHKASKRKDDEMRLVTTTLTAAALYQNRWCMAQVGNSAAYMYRVHRNEMREWTTHSHVYEGEILRYSVGNPHGFTVHLHEEDAHLGDLLLLCTDGLTRCMSYEELQNFLFKVAINDLAWEQLPSRLIGVSKERDAADNVAVVLGHVMEQPQRRAAAPANPRITLDAPLQPAPLFTPKKSGGLFGIFKRD